MKNIIQNLEFTIQHSENIHIFGRFSIEKHLQIDIQRI